METLNVQSSSLTKFFEKMKNSASNSTSTNNSISTQNLVAYSVLTVSSGFLLYNFCCPNVIKYKYLKQRPISYPGDARTNQETKRSQFDAEQVSIMDEGWKFFTDRESHVQTETRNNTKAEDKLTGESAGRHMWCYDENENENQNKNESENKIKSKTKKNKKNNNTAKGSSGSSNISSNSIGESNSTRTTVSLSPFLEETVFRPFTNPNTSDKLYRNQMKSKWIEAGKPLPKIETIPTTPYEACHKAMEYYQMLQCEDGHWAGDYGGPMFLMPGLIFSMYMTKTNFGDKREGMIHYIRSHQQIDGGWGLHIEARSGMFGSCMNYTALRLLGVDKDDPMMIKGRKFIQDNGGAVMTSSWCKFWLATLGLHEWEGINSIPAEVWLLPRWFPFHPGKLWCHCRMVYLPMCYLYCIRYIYAEAQTDPLIQSLKEELYIKNYEEIDWDQERHSCSPLDVYHETGLFKKTFDHILKYYERIISPTSFLRKWGLQYAINYIHAEDIQTNYIDIGPVNKALNMLCIYAANNNDSSVHDFQMHVGRIDDYLWVAEDGMKMQGYNGSQCWDTSFLTQAICESGLLPSQFSQIAEQKLDENESENVFTECMTKAYSYFDRTQIKEDEEDAVFWWRHISKGGWPFSTAAHGWPIADCTAEGLKSVLLLQLEPSIMNNPKLKSKISPERLYEGVNVILSYQNTDGGWATYENNRGYRWYEALNPSEVFGDIMIDYSYVELSSACMQALAKFQKQYPNHRQLEISQSLRYGKEFIEAIQREDGSWYGSWAICFTYGTWFGIEGLLAAGVDPKTSPEIQKANNFILSKQNQQNGGWGESFLSCVNKEWPVDGTGPLLGTKGSGVVQTAWALLALLAGKCQDRAAIDAGIRFLMHKQLPTGDWPQEGITGVFNRSCGITYSQYKNIFPMWALGRYAKMYPHRLPNIGPSSSVQ